MLKSTQIIQKMTQKEQKRRKTNGANRKDSKTVDVNPTMLILNINEVTSIKSQKLPIWTSKEYPDRICETTIFKTLKQRTPIPKSQ